MNKHTRTIVLYAILLALTVVLGWIPYVFLIPLLFAAVHFDLKTTLFAGVSFGVVSLIFSFMGLSLVSMAFVQAPWIPIVTRVLVALIAWLIHKILSKFLREENRIGGMVCAGVTAAVGSIMNTLLVVGCLYLFVPDIAFEGITVAVYIPVMLLSGLIELAVNTLAMPGLSYGYRKSAVYKKLSRW